MNIHIHKNNQQYGPFSQEELMKQIRDGIFTVEDLAWYEGANDWLPIKAVPGISLPPAQPTPPLPTIQATPKLWNPNAAANWSLLFTPIFGALLHAKNWKELNQPDQAQKSIIWMYVSIAFSIVLLLLPDSVGSGPALILIIAWYFSSAKSQFKYIKENNIRYEKKSWGKPILLGFFGIAVFFALAIGVAAAKEPALSEVLESESVSLVTQILQDQLGETAKCKAVSIEEAVSDELYNAVAYLDNGSELRIGIEHKGDQIFVSILD